MGAHPRSGPAPGAIGCCHGILAVMTGGSKSRSGAECVYICKCLHVCCMCMLYAHVSVHMYVYCLVWCVCECILMCDACLCVCACLYCCVCVCVGGPSWCLPPAQPATPCSPGKTLPGLFPVPLLLISISPAGRLQAKVRRRRPPQRGNLTVGFQPCFTFLEGLGCCMGKEGGDSGAAPGIRSEAEVPGRCHPHGTWGWCGTLRPPALRQ